MALSEHKTSAGRGARIRVVAAKPLTESPAARYVWALARVALGWIFAWAFVDKLFGLGYATPADKAWIDGASPTEGFLANAPQGPFAGLYNDLAGAAWADWLFMMGLAGIGAALILGIGMRIAAVSGALLLVLMWTAVLPPENNPFMDDHLIYAIVLIGLALVKAGDTLGLGEWWSKTALAQRFPILK
ncbi:DoxX family membrane protein [Actinomadura sp. 6K520]|jgi:thiosulfate dehydrogenase [quinone] large subunit|uniref:DoxX family membrane protein n=1 Tax=Actinomadura sp. 6K520 TaxID=2530364 RepID=UPI0010444A0D|nr:DoxX family membrane protein [Actinomadura sp. 6K520]TDE22837.1 DoxX family membrane protein [Actinomadura sp. 6K520]